MTKVPTNLRSIEALIDIVATLRGPNGCPWDKEQTHQSLTPFVLEEAHEVVEAIEYLADNSAAICPAKSDTNLQQPGIDANSATPNINSDHNRSGEKVGKFKEELGDLLFQVILHAQLASEQNLFNIHDVIETLNAKMIRRHPHVFGDAEAKSPDEVLRNWEKIKSKENSTATVSPSPFQNIPSALPSLQQACKIGNKTQHLRFDWNNANEVWQKVEEEFNELQVARRETNKSNSTKSIEHELGDVFFSLVQWARHLGIDPEKVSRAANRRFIGRFHRMLEFFENDQVSGTHSIKPADPFRPQVLKDFGELSTLQKEEYWQRAKNAE